MTEKIYLENPYLRQIEARITEKKYMNNKYYIKTNKTIFYPNLAGGQPGDKGTINGVEVLDTYEDGIDIVHVVKENIHSDRVQLFIDWNNRFDYMQQHSGQHLLSSVFYKLFNGETIGFYIGKEYVYIDIDIPKITEEEIEKIEEFANKIIFSNFSIKSYIVEREDMDKLPVRKDPIVNSNIRIVEIDGIDFSPCCGTHLRNTGEIGMIKIRKVESYKGNIRVEFVCGNRALKDYTWKSKSIKDISNLLSSKDKDAYNRVEKLYTAKENLEKENRLLKEKLNKYIAADLIRKSETINGINLIFNKSIDMEFKELQSLLPYVNLIENTIVLFGVEGKDTGQFILSRSQNLQINMKEIFEEISQDMEIRGGGSPQTIQGGCPIDMLDKTLKAFYDRVIENL
ncbi:alanyl-tRNA editing protein [Clostridium sp. Cult1]|uniref:alanyl-tRNA editing protein n=1 Tax=Clostridium sp. Cult1 TaxID=2079002 RepID=UPI001F00A5F8|nr:DHHA1 domain-containing protein [Clostridium sp. Cult1]MCF6463218.1 metal-dependent hydrolase [Clostridium sp. Cult1]